MTVADFLALATVLAIADALRRRLARRHAANQ